MTGKYAPHFTKVPPPYHIAQPQYNNVQPKYKPTQYNQVPYYNAPRGDQTGYKGGGQGRGGFGRGIGPIIWKNFLQPGHYARKFPLPPVTYM
jgi:hypothetical protein